MLSRLTAALCLVAIVNTACTVVVQEVTLEKGDTTGASSWTGWTPPDADDSSTAVEGDLSSTGADSNSTGAPDEESTTGASSTGGDPIEESSTSGDASSSTTTVGSSSTGEAIEEGSTSGEPIDQTTGGSSSTGEPEPPPPPPPVGAALNELCVEDSDCQSGVCLYDWLSANDNLRRCSTACSIDTADSCQSQGHPGACVGSGGNHWCRGTFPTATFTYLAPPPPGPDYAQGAAQLSGPDARSFTLIPAHATDFYIEMRAIKGQGHGPVVFDLYSGAGDLLSSHNYTGDNGLYTYAHVTIKPQGVGKYLWLVARPADGVLKASILYWLKNPYWPNAQP